MDKKKKNIIMIISIAIIVITFFSISYAALTFRSTSFNQQLVVGDIWMKYDELNGLSIEDAVPGSDYSNYFEFTISGKNTYDKKDIYYDFILNRGDLPTNKTEENRIPDKYLKFKLVSVDDSNQETEIFTDKTYASLNNQRIYVETIEKNTTSEVNRKYRLYMTIDNSLEIGNLETAVFTLDEWASAFASVKVNVTGDLSEKTLDESNNDSGELLVDTFNKVLATRTNSYILEDGIYYVSGAKDDDNPNTTTDIDFNYVWYSGKLWRITALYPDGTMKLITEDLITSINWGETTTYSTSWIREWLNQEFLPTLYNYENVIDTNAGWYSITDSASSPTKPTGNHTLTDAVGLLSAYEYYKSYQNLGTYENGYLNVGYNWWLITPVSDSNICGVANRGVIGVSPSANGVNGCRPAINLLSTIEYDGGDGSKTNPYTIKQDQEEIISNVTLLNTRQSGEYVEIENDKDTTRRFRIVGTETINGNLTTKLVLDDYVKIKSTGENLVKIFSNDTTYGEGTSLDYWDYFLNTHWITSLDTSKLEQGTYYLGMYPDNTSYKATVCSSVSSNVSVRNCIKNNQVVSTTWSGYVGLLRVGEMFSSQRGSGYSSSSDMYLITPFSTLLVRYVSSIDHLASISPAMYALGSRPSINLKSDIVIKSGKGTKINPYQVAIDTYLIEDGTSVVVKPCLHSNTVVYIYDRKKKKFKKKKIKYVDYDDLLLVWDFDKGEFAVSKPVWVKKKETSNCYNLLTFSDGTTLKTINQHRIFNKEKGMFTLCMTDDTPIGTTTFNSNGEYVKLVSKEVIYKEVDFYNVITNYHINLFTDNILTSCRLSNIYKIEDMKYVFEERDNHEYISKLNIKDKWIDGLRLNEQPLDINRDSENMFKDLEDYIKNLERLDIDNVNKI